MASIKRVVYINNAEQAFNSYYFLLRYHYQNLPIKAEPASLLPVEVVVEGNPFKLEDLTYVTSPEWNQLMLHPKNDETIQDIIKAVLIPHPEFKVEVTKNIIEEYGLEERVVLLTMPEVDDKRYDLLTNGVKTLADQARLYINKKYQEFLASAPFDMRGIDATEVDDAKKELKEKKDKALELVDKELKEKQEEIEKAHNEWLEKQEGKDRKKVNSSANDSYSDDGQSLKF